MNKQTALDLTALLDVILIILFAVMLNLNQTTTTSVSESEASKEALSQLETAYEQLSDTQTTLEERMSMLENENQILKDTSTQQEQYYSSTETQYKELIETLLTLNESDEALIDALTKAQENPQQYSEIIEELTANKTSTDTNILMENLHKYTVIANKFLFLDASIDVNKEIFLWQDQETDITISEEDGFDEYLFQLKTKEIADYMALEIGKTDKTYSFILITLKYDPYITRRYYITLITEAIDLLREQNDVYIIFDTQYLIPNSTNNQED